MTIPCVHNYDLFEVWFAWSFHVEVIAPQVWPAAASGTGSRFITRPIIWNEKQTASTSYLLRHKRCVVLSMREMNVTVVSCTHWLRSWARRIDHYDLETDGGSVHVKSNLIFPPQSCVAFVF